MKLLITNGTIVNPANKEHFCGNIFIEDGIIKKIDKNNIFETVDQTIDAQGLIVAPGFIDIHVHFRDPGLLHKEDIHTGMNAAAAGGFTAVCTMPNTIPVTDNPETIAYILEKAHKGNGVKIYPCAAATIGSLGKKMTTIDKLQAAGAVAVSDDGKPVEDTALLRNVMEQAALYNIPYISHSEDMYVAAGACMNEGKNSAKFKLKGNPAFGEASQIARDIMIAHYLDIPVHIAHVSTKMSVDIIAFYKKQGARVTAETAPHYLTLTDESVGSLNANTKMNPPLRTREDKTAMICAIKDGTIDTIATDHAPHHPDEKDVDFSEAPPGIIGLETALPLLLKHVHDKTITMDRLVELFTAGYRILGINGGILKKGAIADITIFDPEYEWTIDIENFKSKSKNSPFHGFHVKGAVSNTIVDGKVIYTRDY